jgi:hypothetical protein
MAGVFFLLHRCFSRVAFVRPSLSCTASQDRFVVAQNFLGASDELIDYLHEVCPRMLFRFLSVNISICS